MLKWFLVSAGTAAAFALVLLLMWRLRRPRRFWALNFERKVNVLVAMASLVSLLIATITLVVAVEALNEARSSGAEQLNTLKAARGSLDTSVRKSDEQLNALNSARNALGTVVAKLEAQTGLLSEEQKSLRAQVNLAERQRTLIERQLEIQQAQYEAQNKHPVLEVRMLNANPRVSGVYRTLLLKPGEPADIGLTVWANNPTYSGAWVYLRNIGTAPAVNVVAIPRTPEGVTVRCVDYPRLYLFSRERPAPFEECAPSSGILPPIEPRPKDRPANMEEPNWKGSEFDPDFDAKVRVNLTVPLDMAHFDMEVVIRADGLSPTRYLVHCHRAGLP